MTEPSLPHGPLTADGVKLLTADSVLHHPEWGVAQYRPTVADDMYLTGPWSYIGERDADGWITAPVGGWKSAPVADDILVDIRCRDGSEDTEVASHWTWDSQFAPITAFRLTNAEAAMPDAEQVGTDDRAAGGSEPKTDAGYAGLPLQMIYELRHPDRERVGWEDNAALMIDAADEIEKAAAAIRALEADKGLLTAELDAVSAAIGTVEFMDPPDGGDVPLCEQVRRMRVALTEARTILAEREREAAIVDRILSDYQTSGTHHPDHILILTTDFDALAALRPVGGE